jgi:hypothetical protein
MRVYNDPAAGKKTSPQGSAVPYYYKSSAAWQREAESAKKRFELRAKLHSKGRSDMTIK